MLGYRFFSWAEICIKCLGLCRWPNLPYPLSYLLSLPLLLYFVFIYFISKTTICVTFRKRAWPTEKCLVQNLTGGRRIRTHGPQIETAWHWPPDYHWWLIPQFWMEWNNTWQGDQREKQPVEYTTQKYLLRKHMTDFLFHLFTWIKNNMRSTYRCNWDSLCSDREFLI